MDTEVNLINLNTATLDDLDALPGVNRSVAKRIIDARPFSSIEELDKVSGLKQKTLGRLKGLVSVEPVLDQEILVESQESRVDEVVKVETQPDAEEVEVSPVVQEESTKLTSEAVEEIAGVEAVVVEPVSVKEVEEVIPEEKKVPIVPPEPKISEAKALPVSPASPAPAYATRTQVLLIALVGIILAVLIGVGGTLLALVGLNGGLRYASYEDAAQLYRQVNQIDTQIATMQTELDELGTRVSAVESLATKVAQLGEDVSQLQLDMDKAVNQIGTLNQQVDDLNTGLDNLETQLADLVAETQALSVKVGELSTTVEGLVNRTNIFQKFFDGLKDLMNIFNKP